MNFDALQYNYASQRSVIYANRGMVATSQPLAAQAGLDIMKKRWRCLCISMDWWQITWFKLK